MENEYEINLASDDKSVEDTEAHADLEKDEELKEVQNLQESDAKDEYYKSKSPIPVVGMLFNTDMDAYYFYNRYAKKVGFSIRKKTMYCNANGKVKRRDVCCSLEGCYQKKATPKKKRPEKRCGCRAMLIVKLSENGKYVVTNFVEEHNHPLENPENAHMLRSHRQIEPCHVGLVQDMDAKTNISQDSHGEIISTNLDPSFSKRYGELSYCAQTLVAKGASTDEKFSLAISEMLRTISKLDSLPNSNTHGSTLYHNNSTNPGGQIDGSIVGQAGTNLLVRDPIPKKRVRQPKGHMKNVLEKRPKKKKDITSKQAEPVVGSSGATQEKDQNPKEAPNTSAQSTLGPNSFSPGAHLPPNICSYPRHPVNQDFPYHEHRPKDKPSVPCDDPFIYSQGLGIPMDYMIEQHTASTQFSQARVGSSHETRPPARMLDFLNSPVSHDTRHQR